MKTTTPSVSQSTTAAPGPQANGAASASDELVFWLNGRKCTITNPDPSVLLVDYLHSVGLTGTKVSCGQGGCGACTVMLSHRDRLTGKPVHRAVNSCLRPLCSLDGMAVTTVEGIGSVQSGLDPAQHCIAANNGSQCGFCTPGFVMTTHAFLQQNPERTQQELEDLFGGNLCRCTGYRPILHGVRTLACDYDPQTDQTQKCSHAAALPVGCRSQLKPPDVEALPGPAALRALHFKAGATEWHRPLTLPRLHALKNRLVREWGRDHVKLVCGNTSSGIYPDERPRHFIDISAIAELAGISEHESGIDVGAAVPIQQMIDALAAAIDRRPPDQTTGLRALKRHASLIAGYQVRCSGSVAGNIFMTRDHVSRGAPFPSDLFTALATLGTTIVIGSREYKDARLAVPLLEMPATESLPDDAVILSFGIPFTRAREYVQTHRVARRIQMAHPLVNAGFRFRLNERGVLTENAATIIFGGLSARVFRASATEMFLAGKAWDNDTLQKALAILHEEIRESTRALPPIDEEGISRDYRLRVAEGFFFKAFLHVAVEENPAAVSPRHASAAALQDRPLSSGRQESAEYPELYPLLRPLIKQAAWAQATGEARFTQDRSLPARGLHAAIFKSSKPHARFSIGAGCGSLAAVEELLRQRYPDFQALVTVADIPTGGHNLIGLGDDDPVFSDGVVTSVGAPIGLAVAETIATAREVAALVEREFIHFIDLPAVISLDEAIAHNTAMPMIRKAKDPDEDVQQRIPAVIREGSNLDWLADPSAGLPGTEILSGTLRTGPQAHFYMETMCALAVPGVYPQIEVFNSTQNPSGDQARIARALGITVNQVTVSLDQIGGGFGGKQHRASMVGAQAAVAARKLNRPVRLLYDRATDMAMVGKRHPYLGSYHVAYRSDGTIDGMQLDLKSDAGDTYDCSFAVMDLSLLQADACYNIPTLEAKGTVYRTNKTSNTAFRTFGTVQPTAVVEDAIEHVAHRLSQSLGRKVLPEEIRRKNMYRTGSAQAFDRTHLGQDLFFCNIREIWDRLCDSSNFWDRARAVEDFNRNHRWRKRGVAMIPGKYGIGFTEPRGSLNASSALVNINMPDGSVVVTHGGVEMGQGLSTKIAQVAATTLGLPLELIRVTGINSDAIVNAPATAASTGYDLNAGAVEQACLALRNRLENFCRDLEQFNPHDSIVHWRYDWAGCWNEIVSKAWLNRVNLSAAELYKSPHYEGPSERRPRGRPFFYFVFSAAVTEVEIDVLTGEFTILRTDIVYDAGKSPNPAIDIGQIEGGYVQGVGFATTEELVYRDDGALVTDNIWSYKPPCSKTIPIDFRVRLHPVDEARFAREALAEKHAVKGSKTTGEPCLTLGLSAFFAIKRAVMDARRELTGGSDWLTFDLPATCQRIESLCGVKTEALTL